jgi:UDP-N-acetylglucosamine 3-dehydrogenase
MAKLKVGVIGCGAIAEAVHIPGYRRISDKVEIAAIADIDKQILNDVGDRYGISDRYLDWHDLIRREDIDAVSVCTPNYLHAEQTIAALGAGKHVMCEKPMATSVQEAQAMLQARDAAGKKLFVGFTHRYMHHNIRAKQIVDEGVIGSPYIMRIRFSHDGPYKSWSAKTDWFFDRERAKGGALLDMGIHAIDLMRWFFGEATAVKASCGTYVKEIDVEDTAILIIEFGSGKIGYIEVGWSTKPGAIGFELYGTEGTLINDYSTPLRLYLPEDKSRIFNVDDFNEGWVEIKDCIGGGWDTEIEQFVDSIRNDIPITTGGESGLAAVRIAEAAYQSAATGNRIDL